MTLSATQTASGTHSGLAGNSLGALYQPGSTAAGHVLSLLLDNEFHLSLASSPISRTPVEVVDAFFTKLVGFPPAMHPVVIGRLTSLWTKNQMTLRGVFGEIELAQVAKTINFPTKIKGPEVRRKNLINYAEVQPGKDHNPDIALGFLLVLRQEKLAAAGQALAAVLREQNPSHPKDASVLLTAPYAQLTAGVEFHSAIAQAVKVEVIAHLLVEAGLHYAGVEQLFPPLTPHIEARRAKATT